MGRHGRRDRGGCGGGCASVSEMPSHQPSHVRCGTPISQAEATVLAESAIQDGYDKAKTRVALRDGSSGGLSITGAPATGEAAAFRRATAARLSAGAGTPSLDLASRDELVAAGTEVRQHVENVLVRCGRRHFAYQPQVVTEVVQTHRLQSQSVVISDIPDPMGRMHLSLGSNDRAFIDLASIGKNCLISLEKAPGSAGKAVLIFGSGRPVESISFDPQKGTAVIKVGGQEVSVSGISSPSDLLIATSALEASQGVLADIGAVAAAVTDRNVTPPQTSTNSAEQQRLDAAIEAELKARENGGKTDSDKILADKDRQIAELKAQLEQMKQQMEQMQKQLQAMQGNTAPPPSEAQQGPSAPTPEATTPPTSPSDGPTPPPVNSEPNPAAGASVDYQARASAVYQELSKWRGGTWFTPGVALGLSSQLKVMHQFSDLSPEQAKQLLAAYESKYAGSKLIDDIDGKMSVGRAAALKAKLSGFNPTELAELMRSNIDAWVKDSPEVLVDLVANLSSEQRQAVAAEFQKLTGETILAKLEADWGLYDRATLIKPFLSGEEIPGLLEAAELYQLMDGVGYNDQPLILETIQRGEASPAEIAQVFGNFYAKAWDKASLLEVLQDEVDEQTVSTAASLINPQASPAGTELTPAVGSSVDYQARASAVYQELSRFGVGLGLSSQLKVMHQFSDLSQEQAKQLMAAYESKYAGRKLIDDVDGKMSVGRAAALKAKLSGFNPTELAELMRSYIDAWVKDQPEVLIELVTNLSSEQRKVVAAEFQKLTGETILAKLEADWGMYDRTTLIKPFLSGEDIPGLLEAAELYQLMDGVGYNDQPLILETMQRGEASPAEIAQVFGTFYAKGWEKASLVEVLQDEVDEQTVATATGLINPQTPK